MSVAHCTYTLNIIVAFFPSAETRKRPSSPGETQATALAFWKPVKLGLGLEQATEMPGAVQWMYEGVMMVVVLDGEGRNGWV